MTSKTQPETARQLLQQAQQAYENGDDKTCARHLWQAVFQSIRQLATAMGHPCESVAEAKQFVRYLEREHGNKMRYAEAMLGFGLDMLDHAEGGEWSQDPEFAWTFPEFPLVMRQVARIVETFAAHAEVVKS